MNALSPYVLTVAPTRVNLDKLLESTIFGWVHPLIDTWLEYFPRVIESYRAELKPDTRIAGRYPVACLYELAAFGKRHIDYLAQNGPIEGYDASLVKAGKEYGNILTTPIIFSRDGKVNVDLVANNLIPEPDRLILYRTNTI